MDGSIVDSNIDETRKLTWKRLLFQGSKTSKYQVCDFVRLLKSKQGANSGDDISGSVGSIEKKQIWVDAHETCHSCGGHINLNEVVVEQFVRDNIAKKFPAHASCRKSREGMNPFEIIASMKLGFWLMTGIREQKSSWLSWLKPLMEEWAKEEGETAETLLFEFDTPCCGTNYKMYAPEQLIYSVRRMYLDDRERPKYAVWWTYKHLETEGVEAKVPVWDSEEDWTIYYERKKSHYENFIDHREQDRINRNNGKPKDLKKRCWERGGGVCHFCRGFVDAECSESDHIKPHSKGGDNGIWNFLPIHGMCNRLRSAYPASELITSMLLGRWMTQKIYEGVTDVTWGHNAVHYFLKEKLKKHYSGTERIE